MTISVPQCANCGAPLPAQDAICPACEQELADSSADPRKGKYRCPRCSSRFDKAQLAWWPSNVPWYRPQMQRPRCPHCERILRDRKAATLSPVEVVVFIALMVASDFSPWRPGTQILLLVALGAFRFARWKQAESSVFEEDRYALEDRP